MTSETQTDGDANHFDSWQLVHHYLQPIGRLLALDDISEIMVNRYDEIFIERRGEMHRVDERFPSEELLTQTIIQIGNALDQPVDPRGNPILDARLTDGSRVCAALFPTAARGSCMSIRLFPKRRLSGGELVGRGSLNDQMLAWLRLAVIVRYNILVSGGTASGKTTLLNALSSYIPPSERVITVEDTKEMQLDLPNLLCLEAPHRPRDSSAQRIDMAYLIRTTLRMHPNRIFVGEIRDGAAALAYLHAINTGHDGCSSTIHANNAEDALERMQTLVAGGGGGALPFDVVRSQVRNNLHVLVHAEFTPRHGRRIVEIAELRRQEVVPLWTWDYETAQHIEHTENVRSSVLNQRATKFGALASLT